MQPLWGAAIAVPIVVAKGIMSVRSRHGRGEGGSERWGTGLLASMQLQANWSQAAHYSPACHAAACSILDDEGGDPSFVCERVCTSGRLLKRMGSLSKVRMTPRCRHRRRPAGSRHRRRPAGSRIITSVIRCGRPAGPTGHAHTPVSYPRTAPRPASQLGSSPVPWMERPASPPCPPPPSSQHKCHPCRSSQDPTPNTCVTVCGVSSRDACAEACQRSVCAVPHQVPAWNESCQKRCVQECLKGRAS